MYSSTLPPNVIYIGLQKTGSTFLRGYFSNHPQVLWTRHGAFFQTEVADVDLYGKETVRAQYEAQFAESAGETPCRIDMYEAIGMGYVLKGVDAWSAEHFIKVDSPLNFEHIYSEPYSIAARIKATIPSAKILLTIRSQASWIDSNYRHYFEQLPRGRESLFHFMSTPEGKMVLDVAMFDRVVEIYDKLFGRNQVLVLPMERLEQEEELALQDLCAFLGIDYLPYRHEDKDYNRGRSLGALASTRLEKKTRRFSLFEHLFGHRQPRWQATTEEILRYLACVYAASNARLSKRIGLDLAKLGYPI
jgi:hypothetical protein